MSCTVMVCLTGDTILSKGDVEGQTDDTVMNGCSLFSATPSRTKIHVGLGCHHEHRAA